MPPSIGVENDIPKTSSKLHKSMSVSDLSAARGGIVAAELGASRSHRSRSMGSKRSVEDSAFWGTFFFPDEGADAMEDDASVASSVGYFAKSDFAQDNWQTATDYIPPIGFAVVAGGLALIHPIVFVAGALTAFGTVQAVGAARDCCVDGALCRIFDKEEELEVVDNKVPLLEEVVSDVTYNMSDTAEEEEHDVAVVVAKDEMPKPPLHKQNDDPSLLGSRDDIVQWVNRHYPPLENMAMDNVDFFGLNALEFFEVFFADHAPYTFQEFQRKRQDKDIQYGKWESLDNVRQPSLHNKASCFNDFASSLQERILNFKAKTNSFLGPPYATTTKVQRGLVLGKRLFVLESKTTLTNIPYCDRFHVLDRWVVTAQKQEDGQYHSSLSVYSQVFFSKSCPFESQIVSKSTETIQKIATQWCVTAQEALKKTEALRAMRLQKESKKELVDLPQKPPKKDDDEAIEVKHIARGSSFVVGDESSTTSNQPQPTSSPSRRYRRKSSFGRMSQSFTNYVRRRTASTEIMKKGDMVAVES